MKEMEKLEGAAGAKVNIKLLHEKAVIPTRATKMSVGYDLTIPECFVVQPGRNVIKLGFALEMPYNIEAKIEARSGFSAKGMEGYNIISLENPEVKEVYYSRDPHRFDADVLTGKIDPDYRGEVGVIIKNNCPFPFVLREGTRIAQMTFYRVETAHFAEIDKLSCTDRGDGGYGSTDKQ